MIIGISYNNNNKNKIISIIYKYNINNMIN